MIVILVLIMMILAVYWQVRNHDFVNFDDDVYVTENRQVRAGWNIESLYWAFTTKLHKKWNPLTWLSHMTDCQLFGLKPGMHHLSSLFLHIINTLLLFLILNRMTGALLRSAFVAALFALHPMHVESVAWVADRKDVLSTFFWILTVGAYVLYVEHPHLNRYLLVIACFALGLMAKPMVVTLPLILLLLDYWPLGRRSPALRLVWEKFPLFVLMVASIIMAMLIIEPWRGVEFEDLLSMEFRISNALVSYVSYIGKMIRPSHLAVFYPIHSMSPHALNATIAGLLLICVSFLVILAQRRHPYLATGWLWYIGTLLPVIGLISGGPATMADRYTYVPFIGLFIMVAWGVPDILARWRYQRIFIGMASGLVLLALVFFSWSQLRHWRNSITLFEHALNVTDKNYLAHNNIGEVLLQTGNIDGAVDHFSMAIQLKSDYDIAHNNLGVALARQGRVREAVAHFREALRIKPDLSKAYNNLGLASALEGKLHKAIDFYHEALRIKPDYAEAYMNLGLALAGQGRFEEAISHCAEALRIRPGCAEAYNSMGVVFAGQGEFNKAISHFSEALRIRPDYKEARSNLELAKREAGKSP